jgi:hypothetical protein
MNLDDLKPNWQQTQNELADNSRFDEIAARVYARTSWFERIILRRDRIEGTACVLVLALFSMGFIVVDGWVAKLGMTMVILGAIEVMSVLYLVRRRGARRPHDLPLKEFCAAELASVDRQIWLGRNVTWWYTVPLLAGCLPIGFGTAGPTVAFGISCAGLVAFGWFVFWLNQRAVRNTLLPLREELAEIHQSLVRDEQ